MDQSVIDYVEKYLDEIEVKGKSVIEVGSYNHNGTVRPCFTARDPQEYIGVDMLEGPGVDIVCSAETLVDRFGADRFDIVVTTATMEHVHEWRGAIRHLKGILKPGGTLILTTVSKEVNYHGYPYDYWRYEIEDMHKIFADLENVKVDTDPVRFTVFVTAQKPTTPFEEVDLDNIALYSVLTRRRALKVSPIVERIIIARIGLKRKLSQLLVRTRMFIWSLLPLSLRQFLKRTWFDRRKAA